eukprot:828891-Prymnesium_polylepis.2
MEYAHAAISARSSDREMLHCLRLQKARLPLTSEYGSQLHQQEDLISLRRQPGALRRHQLELEVGLPDHRGDRG